MAKKAVKKVAKKVAAKNGKALAAKRSTREVKMTEREEKLVGLVKEAKSSGIVVADAAKKIYGSKIGEVARPNQAINFMVININKKLKTLGGGSIEKRKDPEGPAGKKIAFVFSKAA